MSKYFDINGSAMIYIPQSSELKNAKTTEEANNLINKECQIIIEKFKNLQMKFHQKLQGFVLRFHLKVFTH